MINLYFYLFYQISLLLSKILFYHFISHTSKTSTVPVQVHLPIYHYQYIKIMVLTGTGTAVRVLRTFLATKDANGCVLIVCFLGTGKT